MKLMNCPKVKKGFQYLNVPPDPLFLIHESSMMKLSHSKAILGPAEKAIYYSSGLSTSIHCS
jgi:hypothetical protein